MTPEFRYLKPGSFEGDTLIRSESEERTEEEKAYRCIICGQNITTEKNRLPVQGQAEHTFTNPHGFVFTIGCFSEAPGCGTAGSPTTEFTWFPGYAWSYAVCGQCKIHLGWHFTGESGSFFGLILNRISKGE